MYPILVITRFLLHLDILIFFKVPNKKECGSFDDALFFLYVSLYMNTDTQIYVVCMYVFMDGWIYVCLMYEYIDSVGMI